MNKIFPWFDFDGKEMCKSHLGALPYIVWRPQKASSLIFENVKIRGVSEYLISSPY